MNVFTGLINSKALWNRRKFSLQQWMKIHSLSSRWNRFFGLFLPFLRANGVKVFFKLFKLSPESLLLLSIIDVEVSFKG